VSWASDWLRDHPAPEKAGPPIDISYSQARAFLECPWLFKLKYLERMRPAHTPASSLGISLHGALESYHRRGADGVDEALALYDERWCHEGFTSAQEQMEWYSKGERILSAYIQDEQARKCEVIGVEKEFQIPLGWHTLIGLVDRVDRRPDGSIEVIDYKTHLDVLPEEEVAEDLQLRLYGAGLRDCFGWEPAWLSVDYVAARKRVSTPFDEEKAEEALALVERVADLISTKRGFEPELSYCPSCPLRNRCARSGSRDA